MGCIPTNAFERQWQESKYSLHSLKIRNAKPDCSELEKFLIESINLIVKVTADFIPYGNSILSFSGATTDLNYSLKIPEKQFIEYKTEIDTQISSFDSNKRSILTGQAFEDFCNSMRGNWGNADNCVLKTDALLKSKNISKNQFAFLTFFYTVVIGEEKASVRNRINFFRYNKQSGTKSATKATFETNEFMKVYDYLLGNFRLDATGNVTTKSANISNNAAILGTLFAGVALFGKLGK